MGFIPARSHTHSCRTSVALLTCCEQPVVQCHWQHSGQPQPSAHLPVLQSSLQNHWCLTGISFLPCRAGRIAFWCGVVLVVVIVLHAVLVLFYRGRGRHPPELLEFPRVELFALLLLTQPIGQSAASEPATCHYTPPSLGYHPHLSSSEWLFALSLLLVRHRAGRHSWCPMRMLITAQTCSGWPGIACICVKRANRFKAP